ncbi:MAG: hypothetical protein V3S10_01320, partial [Dehalococcoidales bacterium]
MKYPAVIFDLFGTLVNNLAYDRHRAVTAETATLVGAPPEDFIRLWAETAFERNTGILPTSA